MLFPFFYTAIEIGFTTQKIYHTETAFKTYSTLIKKSIKSEQTFSLLIESTTLLSGIGQRATLYEDFSIGGYGRFVHIGVYPEETYRYFAYLIYGDSTPENQEAFQVSITSADSDSPAFGCSITNGCYRQIEVVIIDDDGE